jgi:glycosyltransferase involved in cell wall biosynthesis
VNRPPQSIHAVHIGFFADPRRREPAQLLRDWPSLVDVAESAASAGARVSVLQASTHTRSIVRNDVRYEFFPFGRQASIHPRSEPAGTARPTQADTLEGRLHQLRPDVLHVHGLDFADDVGALSQAAPGIPILLQDHASRVPRWWRRARWRRGHTVAAGVSFCALDQAQPFVRADLIRAPTQIYEIPECPSRFRPGDQAQARLATGLGGDPCVLWVGHLDRNKDPLTVLAGISEAVRSLPELQLWCCFGTAPLLAEVEQRIGADGRLRERVHLLGRVAHERIESFMRAADFFVLGSHREGSGYSVIEALACGLPPVVSDIPSFRSLTGNASVGALWPCDEPGRLAAALVEIASRPREPERVATRAHFERELSAAAVGRKLNAAYGDLLTRGRTHGSSSLPQPRAAIGP